MKTKTYRLLALAGAALLGLSATSSLHAYSVLNGSFEDPALSDGSYDYGSGDNWTVAGYAYVITNGAYFGTTPYGNQWEYLDVGSTDTQIISSAFTLNATYTLSVSASDVFDEAGDQVTVLISGGATATQTFAIPRNEAVFGALPFATYTLDFTPTSSAPVTLTIINDTNPIALDNVQLSGPAAVPDHGATLPLLGFGAVSLLALRRRFSAA
jgi:hypothetical protein